MLITAVLYGTVLDLFIQCSSFWIWQRLEIENGNTGSTQALLMSTKRSVACIDGLED